MGKDKEEKKVLSCRLTEDGQGFSLDGLPKTVSIEAEGLKEAGLETRGGAEVSP